MDGYYDQCIGRVRSNRWHLAGCSPPDFLASSYMNYNNARCSCLPIRNRRVAKMTIGTSEAALEQSGRRRHLLRSVRLAQASVVTGLLSPNLPLW
jgi:hypothetical protein